MKKAKKQGKKPVIAVVGSGVVGQATGKGFAAQGFEVLFIDINSEIVKKLREEGFRAYTSDELLKNGEDNSDITLLTVSTPTNNGKINLKYMKAAVRDLGRRLKQKNKYHVVVVRSTVVPGTTEDVVRPILERASGKRAGADFGLAMNPEYLREVSALEDFENPWLVTIGQLDRKSGNRVEKMYADYDTPIHRVSIKEAEMQKYVHNLFNAAKISFFNEMREVAEDMGLDADTMFQLTAESCEGMWNTKYGTKDFGPYDGMCLPKDTQAFLAWAEKQGYTMPHLTATIAVNDRLAARQAWADRKQRVIGWLTRPFAPVRSLASRGISLFV